MQPLLVRIGHRAAAVVGHLELLIERDAPLREQIQMRFHRMYAGFHDHELPARHGFQLVGRHERPLDHLHGLAGIVFAFGHRAGQHRPTAQRLGHGFRRAAVGRKAAKQRHLRVVHDDVRALFAVILLKLCQRLDDRHNL